MFPACAVVEAACEIYHPGYPKKNRGFQPRDLSCVLKFFWEGICFFPGIIYYNQTNVICVRTVVTRILDHRSLHVVKFGESQWSLCSLLKWTWIGWKATCLKWLLILATVPDDIHCNKLRPFRIKYKSYVMYIYCVYIYMSIATPKNHRC